MAKHGLIKRDRERQQKRANQDKASKREQRKQDRANRPDDFDPFTIVERERLSPDE